ncbi:MAG TPA: hypothetical protein VLA89_05490 [Gemmatimonadales bacterium]|nr:hypothetical protein [Gemmatimonadales bacterium]
MSYSLRIRTRTSGALFDARGNMIMGEFADDLEELGAEWALRHIKRTYHTHFKHPTGYYESNVETHNTTSGTEVWDGGYAGPVYGPWLEGVGSRNLTTRFKGYHAFRKAASALDRRIDEMGERLLYRNVIHRL